MNIAIDIPDHIGQTLAANTGSLPRVVLEALALHSYRAGTITAAQVQEMLGLPSRWATESFLHRNAAWHDYTTEDLDNDVAAIRSVSIK